MKDKKMVCNKCKKTINTGFDSNREDYLHVVKDWGYFSKRDMQTHEFVICEECYEELLNWFELPVIVTRRNEAM